jgi:sugar lactone lactonase YvrE
MSKDKQEPVTTSATTRRQFTGLICGTGLLALPGCGGGSSDVPPVAPQITRQPQSVSETVGQSVTLLVQASGSNLVYQWLRGGVAIAGATASILVFTAQASDEQARFSVQVSNTAGTVVSADAVLTLSPQIEAGISLLAGQIDGTGAAQDGVGEQARFGTITGTCVDRIGNLYLIDTSNTTLRKVSPSGVVTTLFQNFPADSAVAVDADGNFYGVRDRATIKVRADGSQQALAGMPGVLGYADGPGAQATFARPTALAFDAQGNLLVADAADFNVGVWMPNEDKITFVYGGTLRKITPAGVVSTIAGKAGQTHSSFAVWGPSAATLPSSVDASQDLLLPNAIACDGQGNIYVADYMTNNVKRFANTGSVSVLAIGDIHPGNFYLNCAGVAVLGSGEVFFGQSNGEYYSHDSSSPYEGVIYPVPSANFSYDPARVVLRRIDLTGAVHDFAGGQSFGAKLGPLPGSLGAVGPGGLVAATGNALIRCTRTAVLRIRVS